MALDHRARRAGQRWHDRSEDDAADARLVDAGMGEKTVDEQPELVCGALAQRGETPALHELRALEHAEDHVRVADVNG